MVCAMPVDSAAPAAPMAGQPKWPYMKTQLPATLSGSINSWVQSMGMVCPMDSLRKRGTR